MLSEFLHVLTLAVIYMVFIWCLAKEINNWSVVDVFWAYGFALFCIKHLIFHYSQLSGANLILIGLTIAWSIRLGTHLAKRIFGDLSHEDGRYVHFREIWKNDLNYKMFEFYMIQALALALLCLPVISSFLHTDKDISVVQWVGAGLTVLGFLGEFIADSQLRRFKKTSTSRNVCDVGLWAWSRHPNYFCEWLIWVGFALLSYNPTYYGIPGFICAGIMFYLLTRVSGIPLTEEHLLRSRGEAYRDYQARVPAFWPKIPKK